MEWQDEPNWKRVTAMEGVARAAIARWPDRMVNWVTLATTLKMLGKIEELADLLDQARGHFHARFEGRKALVAMLLELGEDALAVAEVDAIAARADGDEAQLLQRRTLVAARQWKRLERQVVEGKGGVTRDDLPIGRQWKSARTRQDLEGLIARCRSMREADPADTEARHFLAHSLASIGAEEEARALMALREFLKISELPLPAGYRSGEEFRAELAAEIRSNPTLESDPQRKATRGGWQTSRLGLPGELAVAALVAAIKTTIGLYVEGLRGNGDDFAVHAPGKARLDRWAVIYGAQGRQKVHYHPSGWLSGVFFVAAPSWPDGVRLGSLLVGECDRRHRAGDPPWGVLEVDPVPGRLVLFPSFVPHAVRPCGFGADRISIAFDVVPLDGRCA